MYDLHRQHVDCVQCYMDKTNFYNHLISSAVETLNNLWVKFLPYFKIEGLL